MQSAYAGTWSGAAGLQLGETYSDNIGRQPTGTRSNWATEASPYITYSGRGARSSGSLDARLQNYLNSDSQTGNRTGLQLNATGNLEAYENHLFIDGLVNNSRQQVSQFQAANASYGRSSNSTEVTRLSLSPYLQWHLGNATQATLRYRYDRLQSNASFASGQADTATLDLRNGSAFGRLGWAFNATHYDAASQSATAGSTNSYSGKLTYAVTPELMTSLFGGQEFTDFVSGNRQRSWNWGGGLQWHPDELTNIVAQTSKRFFGRGFNYQISHHFQRSALEWSYSRDLSALSNTTSLGQVTGVPSADVAAYNAELAATSYISDPEERKRVVREHLAARGISIYDIQLDYLSGQTSINKQMRLAWVMYGVSNSVTLSVHRSDRQAVAQGGIVQLNDDLSTHSEVKETGWDANWTHNLSALTTWGWHYGNSDISGLTTGGQLNSTHSATIGTSLNTQLAPSTTGSVGYTHTRSTGTADYRENAVAVQLNHRF
ncbi:MAG: hypothetical protein JWM03_1024 [Rhodocyclales bacterium]|nr:hypothetical protein [Rhodocyclales bacterium]